MKKYLIILFLFSYSLTSAQYAYFPTEGTITYEKTFHIKNLIKRHIAALPDGDFQKTMMSNMVDKAPETAETHQKLYFKGQKYAYEYIKEDQPAAVENLMRFGLFGIEVNSLTDLKESVYQASLDFVGTKVVLEDSLLDVKWKITNEYREIAGYETRRANGITLDSMYVVAFYTDQIPISAGPGAVHGLPGTILGLVVPELHYNIYATKVDMTPPVFPKNSGQKKKEKPMTRKEFYDRLKSNIGQYIDEKQYNLIMSMILI